MIRIRNARSHNLKGVSLDIPRHRLVVVTGLSGSGKSSLAFDTIFAEGQRRYIESLSAYARQFLEVMNKPDVDSIEGLSPTISIDQKATSHNPRSTVGTVTEILDYLRLMYARVGKPHCPVHRVLLQSQNAAQIVDSLRTSHGGRMVAVLAPVVIDRKGEYHDLIAQLSTKGFSRIRIDGTIYPIDEAPSLAKTLKHTIEIVVDRLTVNDGNRQRLLESIESALAEADDRVAIMDFDSEAIVGYSTRYACEKCGYAPPEIEPKLFSFNNIKSACPSCHGLGEQLVFDVKKIVCHPQLSLADGAIPGWDKRNASNLTRLRRLGEQYGFRLDTPFEKLSTKHCNLILYGAPKSKRAAGAFGGVIGDMEKRYHQTSEPHIREEYHRRMVMQTCPACEGGRLSQDALAVLLGGRNIAEISQYPLKEMMTFLNELSFSNEEQKVAERVLKEIMERLGFLVDVGLDYLTIGRSANTLSGGEMQRIRLASQVGSGLTGVTYVLDEPSIGLHQCDNQRLLKTLLKLRDLENTIIVIEHDEETIRSADEVIDMGPGAGEHGGHVVAQGGVSDIIAAESSITGMYLNGRRQIERTHEVRKINPKQCLRLVGARGHNLRNLVVDFPLGVLTSIVGVSGSGKSSLVKDTLANAVHRHFFSGGDEPLPHDRIEGIAHIDRLIEINQSPIGRTPRSNPATYTGVFTHIRDLFAQLPLSRERGYLPGRFSFNIAGGRCEACQGDGMVRVEMHFLPDIFVNCSLCQGKRYKNETLEVRYRGNNIYDVLQMTVEESLAFFDAVPAIRMKLQTLMDVGLGYVRLGQNATTLSGGEGQRVKLSLELSKRDTKRTLYVLDEPTTGLHFHDIAMLLQVLQRLVDRGNTVLVIEHNLDVIKVSDHVIELGPRGGSAGGRLLAGCSPEQLVKMKQSPTGAVLKKVMSPVRKTKSRNVKNVKGVSKGRKKRHADV